MEIRVAEGAEKGLTSSEGLEIGQASLELLRCLLLSSLKFSMKG